MPQPAGGNTATPSGGGGATTATPAATNTAEMTATMAVTSTPEMTATMVATSTPEMTATTAVTSTTGTTATTGAAGGAVQVTLREYAIDMPATLPAGATTFEVTNKGSVTHSFAIEGQGIDKELAQSLAPGEKGTLQVTLATGTYNVYCPVDGHEGKGMKVDLKVQ